MCGGGEGQGGCCCWNTRSDNPLLGAYQVRSGLGRTPPDLAGWGRQRLSEVGLAAWLGIPLISPPSYPARQDATNAAVAPLSKGCAWNQDVVAMVRAAGLALVREERHLAGTVTLLVAARA